MVQTERLYVMSSLSFTDIHVQ